jgi:hypothetical protein
MKGCDSEITPSEAKFKLPLLCIDYAASEPLSRKVSDVMRNKIPCASIPGESRESDSRGMRKPGRTLITLNCIAYHKVRSTLHLLPNTATSDGSRSANA